MGCCCAEIARCQRELNILSGGTRPDIGRAGSYGVQISETLKTAASAVGGAINTDTIGEVQAALGELNRQGEEGTRGLSADCGREIQRLTALLERMRSEDRTHHAAEAAAAKKQEG